MRCGWGLWDEDEVYEMRITFMRCENVNLNNGLHLEGGE